MLEKAQKPLFFIISVLYVLANAIGIYFEVYYLVVVPAVLLVAYFAIFSLDKYYLLLLFLVPVSVPLRNISSGFSFDIYLPSEPMLLVLLGIVILKHIHSHSLRKEVFFHPITVAIMLYLVWMLITSLTGTMPLVSIKKWLSRIWFSGVFFGFSLLFFRGKESLHKFFKIFLWGFTPVILFIIFKHSQLGLFNKQIAHSVCRPFFIDHTSYGATIAFIVPYLVIQLVRNIKSAARNQYILLTGIYLVALVLSYSRAAWLSVLFAGGVYILFYFRLRFISVMALLTGVVLTLAFSWNSINLRLERNKQDSSDQLSEHIQSMSNIKSDASNTERINRWSSAWRMFLDKPVLGFGPGTYMFKYGPYQLSHEKTVISTNAGDWGNAHSEYFGPLAEMGLLGLLSYLGVLLTATFIAIRIVRSNTNTELKWLAISAYLGFSTYIAHGFLNNFLDTDKVSALFWGFLAILVYVDLQNREANTFNELPLNSEK